MSPFISIENKLHELFQQFNEIQKRQNKTLLKHLKDIYLQWIVSYFSETKPTISVLNRYLTSQELSRFRKQIKYKIKELPKNFRNQSWKKQLIHIASKLYVSVYQVLTTLLHHEIELTSHQNLDKAHHFLYSQYLLAFSLSGYALYKLTKKELPLKSHTFQDFSKIFLRSWFLDSMMFFDRWNYQYQSLYQTLNLQIKQDIVQSQSWRNIFSKIEKRCNIFHNSQVRFLSTENEKILSQCFRNVLDQYHIRQYVFIATIDNRTSDICKSLHGKIFSLKEYELGVTAPPLHPNCRSVISPQIDLDSPLSKTSLLSYEEWENKYMR